MQKQNKNKVSKFEFYHIRAKQAVKLIYINSDEDDDDILSLLFQLSCCVSRVKVKSDILQMDV